MWSPDKPDFSKHTATTFLLASWHELFHAYTPDSNQPRLHNVASLVGELADISDRWQRDHRFQNHVGKIQKELARTMEEEDEILLKLPEYRARVQYLVDNGTPLGLLTGCQILSEQRQQYEEAVIESATEAIGRLPKQKMQAHIGLRRLATLAFQHGKEDNDVWDPLRKDSATHPSELFREIIGLSTAGTRTYKCIIAITGTASEIQSTLRKAGFSPIGRSSVPDPYLSKFAENGNRPMFVRRAVAATSVRNAVAVCRKHLGIATGLVSLYRNAQTLHVHPTTLVQVDNTDFLFDQTEQAFRRLHPRSRANLDIREGLELLTDHDVNERLLGAIELLSLASSNSDSRVRLINLWSAIETLSGGHESETVLERVLALLVPLIISRHVSRTVRYLSIETQKLGVALSNFSYGTGFPRSSKQFVSPHDMLRTLASPVNSQPICDLLKFAEHPLLRYRIFRLWETFHEPRKLRQRLMRSKERIEWHIARIYRARNLLVHNGHETPFLVPLLDNLQNYLSMAVQRLIHELKQHPKWDVRHVTEYWNGKMLYFLNSLERNPRVLVVDDFIEDGSSQGIWAS